jgi:nucleoside-diphosphate-sugar epimerase
MTPRKILVSGATGFLGSALVASLRAARPEAEIAAIYVGEPHPPDGVSPIEADLCGLAGPDLQKIREFRPDTVYHLAGLVRDGSDALYRVNVGGTARLMTALEEIPSLERVILASSTAVYGPVPASELPVEEDRRLQPTSDYAISKLSQELVVRDWCKRNRWISTICRISNPIGPGQDERFFVGRLVRQFAEIAANRQAPRLEVWHLAGSRDFIDIRDVGEALTRLGSIAGDVVVNVGGGQETALTSVFETLESLTGRKVELVETRKPEASEILRQQVDVRRLAQLIETPARRPIRETLAAMLRAIGCEAEAG